MRKTAKSFAVSLIVLCLAACIVSALLCGAVLSARHGVHRFRCPDEHCGVCFSIEAHRSAVEGWGIPELGIAAAAFAILAMRAFAEGLGMGSRKDTLFTLGIRLNS